MYIAMKWLVSLTVLMWATMCLLDFHFKINRYAPAEFESAMASIVMKNASHTKTNNKQYKAEELPIFTNHFMTSLYYVMFLTGALIVWMAKNTSEIVIYTKDKIRKLQIVKLMRNMKTLYAIKKLKVTATVFSVVVTKIYTITFKYLQKIKICTLDVNKICFLKKNNNHMINVLLLKKLKEVGEERKKLGQLLINALNENKNIRTKYQLESMAKNRLTNFIENTQQLINENRSKYINFQHLYLVTHQENLFLKARLKRVVLEKEESEKNLLSLINQVYLSKNSELKEYCCRFIVKSKKSVIQSDIQAEIQKFLKKDNGAKPAFVDNLGKDRNNYLTSSKTCLDDSLAPIIADAPRLRGLPGEIVWTVKDKDGLIEKLYEYDYVSEYDNTDTIKRIRQYSVYYDKDCLLDYSSTRTTINKHIEDKLHGGTSIQSIQNTNFLTGSDLFRRFLECNNSKIKTTPEIPELLSR